MVALPIPAGAKPALGRTIGVLLENAWIRKEPARQSRIPEVGKAPIALRSRTRKEVSLARDLAARGESTPTSSSAAPAIPSVSVPATTTPSTAWPGRQPAADAGRHRAAIEFGLPIDRGGRGGIPDARGRSACPGDSGFPAPGGRSADATLEDQRRIHCRDRGGDPHPRRRAARLPRAVPAPRPRRIRGRHRRPPHPGPRHRRGGHLRRRTCRRSGRSRVACQPRGTLGAPRGRGPRTRRPPTRAATPGTSGSRTRPADVGDRSGAALPQPSPGARILGRSGCMPHLLIRVRAAGPGAIDGGDQ